MSIISALRGQIQKDYSRGKATVTICTCNLNAEGTVTTKALSVDWFVLRSGERSIEAGPPVFSEQAVLPIWEAPDQ